jgi:hypothetical protein
MPNRYLIPSLFFLIVFQAFPQSKEKKKDIIFIKPFTKKENSSVDQRLVDTISQQFYLNAQTKYSDNYDVNDESVMKVLNKKYQELLSKNCDADKCMEQIAENTKAKYSIYGDIDDIKSQPGFFLLKMQNLIRDAEGNTTVKSVSAPFQEFQKDYIIAELIKTIENPNYKPDLSKAPKMPNMDIQVSNLNFKPIETGKLPDINNIKIDNSSLDFARYKKAIDEAIKLREEKKHEEAAKKFLIIYKNIQDKEDDDRKKLKSFFDLSEAYFNNSINEFHKQKIEKTSSSIKGSESDSKVLESAIKELETNLSDYENLRDTDIYPSKAFLNSMANNYKERIDIIKIQNFRNAEAKADQKYYKQDLGGAILDYKSILEKIKSQDINLSQGSGKKLKDDLESKIKTTEKNGRDMVTSLIEQLMDSAENHYEDWTFDRDNMQYPKLCKESFDKALKIMQGDEKYRPFISQDLIGRYNKKVQVVRKNKEYPSSYYPKTFDENLEIIYNQKRQREQDQEEAQQAIRRYEDNKAGAFFLSLFWPGWGQMNQSNHGKGAAMSFGAVILAGNFLGKYSSYMSAQDRYERAGYEAWFFGSSQLASLDALNKAQELDAAGDSMLLAGQMFTALWLYSLFDVIYIRPYPELEGMSFQVSPRKAHQFQGSMSYPLETFSQIQWEKRF